MCAILLSTARDAPGSPTALLPWLVARVSCVAMAEAGNASRQTWRARFPAVGSFATAWSSSLVNIDSHYLKCPPLTAMTRFKMNVREAGWNTNTSFEYGCRSDPSIGGLVVQSQNRWDAIWSLLVRYSKLEP